MKTLYITYVENGVPKKGIISESRYQDLKSNPSVENLIVYPSELLMENNYSMMNNGAGGARQILNG